MAGLADLDANASGEFGGEAELRAKHAENQRITAPDQFDAAILTFAEPVSIQAARARNGRHTFSWEPFGGDVDTAPRYEYDPFA